MIPYSEDLLKYFDSVFDKAPLGIYLLDKEGRLVCMSRKMLEILGVSEGIVSDMKNVKVVEFQAYKDSGLDKFIKRGLHGESFSTEAIFQAEVSGIKRRNLYFGEPIFENNEVKYLILYVFPTSSQDIV